MKKIQVKGLGKVWLLLITIENIIYKREKAQESEKRNF